jgi:hypothetical protein
MKLKSLFRDGAKAPDPESRGNKIEIPGSMLRIAAE